MCMRTNVEINDKLMDEILRLTKIKTKKEVIDKALHFYARLLKQRDILNLRGNVKWDGDLHDMRISKHS